MGSVLLQNTASNSLPVFVYLYVFKDMFCNNFFMELSKMTRIYSVITKEKQPASQSAMHCLYLSLVIDHNNSLQFAAYSVAEALSLKCKGTRELSDPGRLWDNGGEVNNAPEPMLLRKIFGLGWGFFYC